MERIIIRKVGSDDSVEVHAQVQKDTWTEIGGKITHEYSFYVDVWSPSKVFDWLLNLVSLRDSSHSPLEVLRDNGDAYRVESRSPVLEIMSPTIQKLELVFRTEDVEQAD